MIYRSLMFTPGTQKEKLVKSVNSVADTIIWDLEDAVHLNDKEKAQAIIGQALDELEEKPAKPIFLRVNQFGTEWFEKDLILARHSNVTGVMLPKAENGQQLKDTWKLMGETGEIIVLIETAVGLKNLEEILDNTHVTGVAFGAIDFAVDLDLTLTEPGLEALYARSRIVMYAKAAGISGIYDTVFPDVHNLESLKKRANSARLLGFTGQLAIHPKQINTLHEVFSPSKADIEWSQKILHHAENEAKGSGVFMLDGKMVDRPVIEKAKQIHTAARRYHLVVDGQ